MCVWECPQTPTQPLGLRDVKLLVRTLRGSRCSAFWEMSEATCLVHLYQQCTNDASAVFCNYIFTLLINNNGKLTVQLSFVQFFCLFLFSNSCYETISDFPTYTFLLTETLRCPSSSFITMGSNRHPHNVLLNTIHDLVSCAGANLQYEGGDEQD